MNKLIRLSKTVQQAIKDRQPVVALESTIIAHGMPYPANLQCGLSLQKTIWDEGAVPATIALFQGGIHVGVTKEEMEQLAHGAVKVSRRDLPFVLSTKQIGATTVSATMIAAHLAQIDVFVTGGIGGVHRGQSMDVSADLRELGRTPVAVVCAGVKSILDIGRTLQYLETEGVPVITYQSKAFPAFFAAASEYSSPITFNTVEDIAHLLLIRKLLSLQNGVLIAVPNDQPAEGAEIETAIQLALKEAN